MADGLTVPSSRADVDGNGVVKADDVFIINSALNDGILPAWWNSLTVRAQRISWIDKILTIDQTDRHPYVRGWFVCSDFSTQTFIHAAYYRDDLNHTQYNGGHTRFNLPMYSVHVPGHAINGILVGEDPLNFDEWRFLEPQNDSDVHPGMWNMPYGGHVKVRIPTGIYAPGSGGSFSTKLDFYVDESGWALEEYSPDLLTTRPAPIVLSPDNHPDLWNPMVVPENPKMIAFEQIRDDMLRVADIHLAELPLMDSPMDTSLVMDSQYSRLLDISKGPDGTIHLLWKGKAEYIPGVFHAELNPLTREISRVTRVSEGTRMVREGRVIVTPGGEVQVFWLEDRKIIALQYSTGIYWTRWTGSEWQPSENITPGMISHLFETLGDPRGSGWIRDFLRHYFDVAVLHDGDIILIWAEPLEIVSDITEIRQLHYDGQWDSPTVIAVDNARGVELLTDSAGTLHLVYWNGKVPMPWNGEGGRGTLVHLTYDGDLWSASEIIDNSGGACCPRMVAGENSEIYMIWERKEGEQIIPVWNKYENGGWHDAQTIGVRPGADAWYPTVEILPDGAVVSAWSSRCPDHVTIGSEIMVQPLVEITYVSTDSKKYSITKDELGAKPYTDRDYAITEISSGLDKGIIVQTANEDKMVTAPAHLKLRLNMDAVVFVCYDKRGVDQDHNPPPCINEWRYCIESISTDDLPASPLVVFTRDVTAGEEITLGGNHYGGDTGALSNYFVVVKTKMCKGDFDWDRDVDGSDLASYIADPAGIILNEFAAEFGRNNCQF
jgi:hypothetical protein